MTPPGQLDREYQAELERWFRRRFGWLCVVYGVFELLHVLVAVGGLLIEYGDVQTISAAAWGGVASGVVGMAVVLGFLFLHLRDTSGRRSGQRRVLFDAALLIVALGSVSLVERMLVPAVDPGETVNLVFRLFVWHLTACLILPWRPFESLRPMVPLMLAWAIVTVWTQWAVDPGLVTIKIALSPAILLPGLAVAAVRLRLHGARFRAEHLGRQFLRLRRELRHARSVHESMFPTPYDDGFVRLDYSYTPALDVGGDFVHLHVSPTGTATVTVIDVTGHGIAAALTVNRLHGEIERLRAEDPRIAPEGLVRALNRYVHLTLARHNIYGTAVCLEVDPHVGQLRYANAGHPPLLVHRADGTVEVLDSTGIMLGAVDDDEYECEQHDMALYPGDAVVCVTDGAFEATDRTGRQLGMEALVGWLRDRLPSSTAHTDLAALVERHHAGRAEDDVLIAVTTLTGVRSPLTRPATRAIAT